MAFLPRSVKSPDPHGVNRSSPYARGLTSLIPGNEPSGALRDIVARSNSTSHPGARKVNNLGRGYAVDSSTNFAVWPAAVSAHQFLAFPWSCFVSLDIASLAGTGADVVISCLDDTTAHGSWEIAQNGTTGIQFFYDVSQAATFAASWPATSTGRHTFFMSIDGSGNAALWVDRTKFTAAGLVAPTNTVGSTHKLRFGPDALSATSWIQATYNVAAVWQGRSFSDAEVRAFLNNPLQLFVGRTVNRSVNLPAASGAVTGTCAAASTVAGTLTGAGALAGTCAASTTVSGTLMGAAALAGTVAASTTVSGTVAGMAALAGSTAASTTVAGTLTGTGALAGIIAAVSALSASPGSNALAGTAAAQSGASANLIDLSAYPWRPAGPVGNDAWAASGAAAASWTASTPASNTWTAAAVDSRTWTASTPASNPWSTAA